MPLLNNAAKIIAKPIPKVVSPRVHAIVDYTLVGAFLGTVALFWNRNKRATLASLICGSADLALILLTDYPGGVQKFISFPAHREIDYGLAAMVATMPESLNFADDNEAKFFRFQGILMTLLSELTPANKKQRSLSRAA